MQAIIKPKLIKYRFVLLPFFIISDSSKLASVRRTGVNVFKGSVNLKPLRAGQ
jgi:hypothetical protein